MLFFSIVDNLKTWGFSQRDLSDESKICNLSSSELPTFSILINSTNSVTSSFVSRTRAVIVFALGGSQVFSMIPPFIGPCQLPVSHSCWLIEMISVGGVFGPADSFASPMPTNSTATIVVVSICFISLHLSRLSFVFDSVVSIQQ